MQNLSKNEFLGVHKGVPPHAGNAKPQYSMYVAFTCFDTTAFGNTIGRLIAISKKASSKIGIYILCPGPGYSMYMFFSISEDAL